MSDAEDPELAAAMTILGILTPLLWPQQQRIIRYIEGRLGTSTPMAKAFDLIAQDNEQLSARVAKLEQAAESETP